MKRHSIVEELLQTGLIAPEQPVLFNGKSLAYLNLDDPEPRNIFLKSSLDPDFFYTASSFIPPKGVFFVLGANYGLCSFGLLPDLNLVNFHPFEASESLARTIEKSTTLHTESTFLVNHACLSDKEGYSEFYFETKQSGQSHVATDQERGVRVRNVGHMDLLA